MTGIKDVTRKEPATRTFKKVLKTELKVLLVSFLIIGRFDKIPFKIHFGSWLKSLQLQGTKFVIVTFYLILITRVIADVYYTLISRET